MDVSKYIEAVYGPRRPYFILRNKAMIREVSLALKKISLIGKKGERDVDLFKERVFGGMTYRKLGKKYGISHNRSRMIVEKMLRRLRHPNISNKVIGKS